jgi:hypothetical protein
MFIFNFSVELVNIVKLSDIMIRACLQNVFLNGLSHSPIIPGYFYFTFLLPFLLY